MAPASTGNDNNKSHAVIKMDHTNKVNLSKDKPPSCIFQIVLIKLMAPAIEETPAKCKLNMAKSTAGPECAIGPDKGG